MSGTLFLDATLPPGTPWWAAVVVALVLAGLNTAGLLVGAWFQHRSRHKGDPAGKALVEHAKRLDALERAPAASTAQVRAGLARVAALETWRRDREKRDEERREQDHKDDLALERLLTRLETKLEVLEDDDRDGRRSNRA